MAYNNIQNKGQNFNVSCILKNGVIGENVDVFRKKTRFFQQLGCTKPGEVNYETYICHTKQRYIFQVKFATL